MVEDSNSTVIGQFYPGTEGLTPNIVMLKAPSGRAYEVYISSDSFNSPSGYDPNGLFYTSTDCTGAAYIFHNANLVVPVAVVIANTAYIPAIVQTTVSAQSYISTTPGSTCSAAPETGYEYAYAVSETVSFASYVPPFSVK
jgi:hypothetical protein